MTLEQRITRRQEIIETLRFSPTPLQGQAELIERLKGLEAELRELNKTMDKCQIKTYIYSDSSERSFHTLCEGRKFDELNELFGKALVADQPSIRLIECRGGAHWVEKTVQG